MIELFKDLRPALTTLRQKKPLVLCLTNFVTMDFMANSLLALGAAPLMTQSMDEMEELITLSQAINVNLGTVDNNFFHRTSEAVKLARIQKKPVVLDPVGAGASYLRTSSAKSFLPYINILRGNASEILALGEGGVNTKGVEATETVEKAIEAVKHLTFYPPKVVVVSGPVDFVTDGKQAHYLPFGSELMPLVTGMGCTLAAVIAAFVASGLPHYQAALFATAYVGLCGQLTQLKTRAPGSFRQLFIDHLYDPDWDLFNQWLQIQQTNRLETSEHAI